MFTGLVRCADQGVTEKRKHEQNPSVLGRWHQKSHALRAEIVFQNQMCSAAGEQPLRSFRVGQASNGIRMDAGGVHDHPSNPTLLLTGRRFADGCTQLSVRIAFESDHPTAAAECCTALFRRQGQQQVETGVIKLAVAVRHPTLTRAELWQCLNQFIPAEPAAVPQTRFP